MMEQDGTTVLDVDFGRDFSSEFTILDIFYRSKAKAKSIQIIIMPFS
jgi:hypothetical protein